MMLNVSFVVSALLLAPSYMRADLLFSLDSPIQSASPGDSVSFTGALFNDDVVDVYLNGASANLPYSELSVDFTDFFALVPPSLAPGESYSGPILSVDITSLAAPGDYFGSFTVQGGPDDVTVDDLATENFEVSVPSSSVAEPSSAPLLGVILLVVSVVKFMRVRRFHG